MTCTSISSQTVEKCRSRGTVYTFCSKYAYALKEGANNSGILVDGSSPRSSTVIRSYEWVQEHAPAVFAAIYANEEQPPGDIYT
jgi:hypothetical protein